MGRKIIFVCNPASGRFGSKLLRAIEKVSLNNDCEIMKTLGPGHASEIAREIVSRKEHPDITVVCGGDGTVNEMAQYFAGSDIPLGIVPCGTVNIMAMELGYSMNISEIPGKIAESSQIMRIPAGELDFGDGKTRYFLLMTGIGFDGAVCRDLSLTVKKISGRLAYVFSGLKNLIGKRNLFEVEYSGKIFKSDWTVACRSPFYAGKYELCPGHLPDSPGLGLFSRIPSSNSAFFGTLLGIPSGKHVENGRVIIYDNISDFSVITPGIPVQADGDYTGNTPVSVTITDKFTNFLIPIS